MGWRRRNREEGFDNHCFWSACGDLFVFWNSTLKKIKEIRKKKLFEKRKRKNNKKYRKIKSNRR